MWESGKGSGAREVMSTEYWVLSVWGRGLGEADGEDLWLCRVITSRLLPVSFWGLTGSMRLQPSWL